MYWYGFTIAEQHALEDAQERGYLTCLPSYHFTVYEAWRLSCERLSRPTVMIGKCQEERSVIFDTSTVYEDEISGSPSLLPTERIKMRVDRIAKRYVRSTRHHQIHMSHTYVFLPHVSPEDASTVARLLLNVWKDASFFAQQARIWQSEEVA